MSEIMNSFHSAQGNGLGLGHLKAASGVAPAETSIAPIGDSEEDGAITSASAGSGEVVIDDVEVSEEAESFLGALTGPGKSHQSTAHRAFAALEENPSLAGLPFGKIVSTLARTGSLASLLPPPPPGETGETGETAATGEAPAGGAIPDPISTDALPTDGPVAGSAALSLLEAIADPDSGEDDDELVELLEAVASPDDFGEADENSENNVDVVL